MKNEYKYSLALAFRSYYVERTAGNNAIKTANNFYKELRSFCSSQSRKNDSERGSEIQPEELANEMFLSIDSLIVNEAEVLKKCSENSIVNNKILTAYFFRIYSSVKDFETDPLKKREINMLYEPVKQKCEELFEQDFLSKKKINGYDYYFLKKPDKIVPSDNYSDNIYIDIPYTEIKINTSVSHTKLFKLLKKIIPNLENYFFSVSDLVKIVSNNSDVGPVNIINNFFTGEDEGETNIFDIMPDDIPDTDFECQMENISITWLKKMKIIYKTPEEQKEIATISYLRFIEDYTLEEIKDYFEKKPATSTLDDKLKRFYLNLRINEEIDQYDLNIKHAMKYFNLLLGKTYKISETIKEKLNGK